MNLMKLEARGPAPWAPEPVSQQPGPLRAGLRSPASRPAPPPTCSVTLATYIPSKPQRGLQTLCGQVWSWRPATTLSTDSATRASTTIQGPLGSEALLTLPLPLGRPSSVSPWSTALHTPQMPPQGPHRGWSHGRQATASPPPYWQSPRPTGSTQNLWQILQ